MPDDRPLSTQQGSLLEGHVTASDKHPHEPQIAPALDAEGRCLVCALLARIEEAEREVTLLRDVATESFRRAVAILSDEAEAYLSAVGDEDDAAERIRWAIRRVSAYVKDGLTDA